MAPLGTGQEAITAQPAHHKASAEGSQPQMRWRRPRGLGRGCGRRGIRLQRTHRAQLRGQPANAGVGKRVSSDHKHGGHTMPTRTEAQGCPRSGCMAQEGTGSEVFTCCPLSPTCPSALEQLCRGPGPMSTGASRPFPQTPYLPPLSESCMHSIAPLCMPAKHPVVGEGRAPSEQPAPQREMGRLLYPLWG